VFQRPFESGADIVYHSSTKYLNGHSDMVGGIVVVRDDGLAERLQFILNAAGAVPGPMDAWLVLRGQRRSISEWQPTTRTVERLPSGSPIDSARSACFIPV
jgi:hypothetical protein